MGKKFARNVQTDTDFVGLSWEPVYDDAGSRFIRVFFCTRDGQKISLHKEVRLQVSMSLENSTSKRFIRFEDGGSLLVAYVVEGPLEEGADQYLKQLTDELNRLGPDLIEHPRVFDEEAIKRAMAVHSALRDN